MGATTKFKFHTFIALVFMGFVLSSANAAAQQQTGQVAPGTQNPQINSPQLFNQNNNVQTPGPQNLLNRQTEIKIPAGEPALPSEQPENRRSRIRPLVLILLSAAGLTVSVLLFRKSAQIEEKTPPKQDIEKPEAKKSDAIEAPVRKKKKPKNKGKPRKRR